MFVPGVVVRADAHEVFVMMVFIVGVPVVVGHLDVAVPMSMLFGQV